MINDAKRQGTRIFKKATPNGKITVYLGKRDFIDHLTHVDPIEGVVLVDPEYVKGRKVFVHLFCAFRHGREEDDFQSINCHKDLFLNTKQVYPVVCLEDENGSSPIQANQTITRLQERLMRKLGSNTYPFSFKLPTYTPASVSLLLNSADVRKPCRVDYELKVYVTDGEEAARPRKRNSVRMIIRKLTFAPDEMGPQPTAEVVRDFLMSLGSLRIEASLDKQKYFHGESIAVNVLVDNNSGKTVKRIKLIVRQYTVICLPNASPYKCNVAEINSEEGFPICPSQTGWCKVYHLCPLLSNNRDKMGLALDGDLKHEDTNLASSTIIASNSSREALGIVVQYKVKIRLILGFGLSDVCLELPFILTHPNPELHPGPPTEAGLDEVHFAEAGRQGDDESSGGEDATDQSARPISTAVTAVRPQMGVLAKRTASNGCGNSRSPTVPPTGSHIAEFLRASEMPVGMAAFTPAAETEPEDVLSSLLGIFPEDSQPHGCNGITIPSTEIANIRKQPYQTLLSPPPPPPPPPVPVDICSPRDLSTADTVEPLLSPLKAEFDDAGDLIFEDFARLRVLQQQQPKQQTAS